MEESNSHPDLFGTNDLEAPSQKRKWPALSKSSTQAEKALSTASTIQPGQRITEQTVTPTPWSPPKKTAEDYARDWVGKYAQYFEKDRILPIPELVEAVEPKNPILRHIRLDDQEIGRGKEIHIRGVLKDPCRYFCRLKFAMWDILLPSEYLAKKLAGNITTKFFRLQPEYKGHGRIRVTVCNVPMEFNRYVLAAYISDYGVVEEVLPARSAAGTAHGDYIINISENR